MPLIDSDFKNSRLLFHHHLQTIYPGILRRVGKVNYDRERINTPDKDFLDLDWSKTGSKKLVIISHGLEGNSERSYMLGMARIFNENGWDALAWNYRGCSEEMNRNLIMYHSGATYDLDLVVKHASESYEEIALVGFSLGGNLTLKYLGEQSTNIHSSIKGAVIFSVPMDLHQSSLKMNHSYNRIYTRRFINHLSVKLRRKAEMFPGEIKLNSLRKDMSIFEFDHIFTAPIHGFKDAEDYYYQCSAIRFIEDITIPTLIVNAQNDSFLSESCYPENILNTNLYLEYPQSGGHVGFTPPGFGFPYWSEKRAVDFILSLETIL